MPWGRFTLILVVLCLSVLQLEAHTGHWWMDGPEP